MCFLEYKVPSHGEWDDEGAGAHLVPSDKKHVSCQLLLANHVHENRHNLWVDLGLMVDKEDNVVPVRHLLLDLLQDVSLSTADLPKFKWS